MEAGVQESMDTETAGSDETSMQAMSRSQPKEMQG